MAGSAVLFASTLLTAPVFAQHGGGHGGHFGGHFGGHGGVHVGGHGLHLGIGHHGVHLGIGHGGGHYYDHYDVGHYAYDHHYLGHHLPFHSGAYLGSWYGAYDEPYYDFYSPAVTQRFVRVEGEPIVARVEARPTPNERRAGPSTSAEGLAYKRRAKQAFLAGNYNETLRYANHALVEMPRNGELYLFTGQAFFAIGDYQSAAAAIHQGASLLDSKDWGQVVGDYRRYYRGSAFVDQMVRLNDYIKKNPNAAYARFVRGYQHGFLGHEKTAIRDLTKALELESRDELAARLLERFGGTVPERAPQALPVKGPARDQDGDHHDGHDHNGYNGSREDSEAQIPPAPKAPSAPPLVADWGTPTAADSRRPDEAPRRKNSKRQTVIPKGLTNLSASDRAVALAQRVCPVTADVLGEMGTPIKVRVSGRDVFVCCQGCVEDLKSDPKSYLARLDDRRSTLVRN